MEQKVTLKMIEELNYDDSNYKGDHSSNTLKTPTEKLLAYTFVSFVKINPESFYEKLLEYKETIAEIESKDNCIPLSVARKNVEMSMSMLKDKKRKSSAESETCYISFSDSLTKVFDYFGFGEVYTGNKGNPEECSVVLKDKVRHNLVNFLCRKFSVKIKETPYHKVYPEQWTKPQYTIMTICESSDMNAAIHYISTFFDNYVMGPFGRLDTVFIQESCLQVFLDKLENKLRKYPKEMLRDQYFLDNYKIVKEKLEKLTATTIQLNEEISPIICQELDRAYFDNVIELSPVILVKSFRTTKEVVALIKKMEKENIVPNYHSIWTPNFSQAYEVIRNSETIYSWINCFGVWHKSWNCSTQDLKDYGKSTIEDSYFYQCFSEGETYKCVAFPVGVTFAN